MSAFFTGFLTSLGLILAIGSQNAFVLRQGIKGEYVAAIVAFCAISDAFLIFLGVFGASALIQAFPWLGSILKWVGIAFLMFYAFTRFKAAWECNYMDDQSTERAPTLKLALLTCAGFTFLNPHVYLDTWLLMGSLSLPYQGEEKLVFAIGASLASFVFFTCLGFGATFLRPLFQSARAWQILDILIGLMMLGLAYGLWRAPIH